MKRAEYVELNAPRLLLETFKGIGLVPPNDLPKYVEQCVTAAGLMFDNIQAMKGEKTDGGPQRRA